MKQSALFLALGLAACTPTSINLPTGDASADSTADGSNDSGGGTMSCNIGTHLCANDCVSNDSIATCGQRCSPCAAPANGTASCDGETCLFECNTGFHRCGERCVSDSAPETCGSRCAPCQPVANTDVQCESDNGTEFVCQAYCRDGFDLCDGDCVDKMVDSNHCGECGIECSNTQLCLSGTCTTAPSCDDTNPCPGFSYCDGGLCRVGCSNTTQCGTNEMCNTTSHSCECNTGFHACNGVCVSNSALTSCGNRCNVICSTPDFGVATCDGNSCGAECITGFHRCGNACVSNSSANSCGSRCSPCPGPSDNGIAICADEQCGVACNEGFTSCGGQCVNTANDRNNCGICGRVCSNGSCSNGTCSGNQPDSGTPSGQCLSDSTVEEGDGLTFVYLTSAIDHSIGSCQQSSPGVTPDVTFTWTAPISGFWRFSAFDQVQLYARTSCTGTDLACANFNPSQEGAVIMFSAQAGTTYYITVDHVFGSTPPSQVQVQYNIIESPN